MLRGADIQLTNCPAAREGNVVSPALPQTFIHFLKFCIVGGSGVVVDMAVLYLLADPTRVGWNATLSKICAAEIALINNFIWNEYWTFRSSVGEKSAFEAMGSLRRFALFNGYCGIGIGLAVLLLYVFYVWLGWNLYLSNLLAVVLVTLWNFILNARFTWGTSKL